MRAILKPLLWAVFMYLLLNNFSNLNESLNSMGPVRQIEKADVQQRPQQNGGSSKKIAFYFAPGCVFCEKMKKKYLKDLKAYCQKNNITFEMVDGSKPENEDRVKDAEIPGYPTLRLEGERPKANDKVLVGLQESLKKLTDFADLAK